MTRVLAIALAVMTALSGGLGWSLYRQIQANGTLKHEAKALKGDLDACQLAAKLDSQEALNNYEASSLACQRAIKSAVAAVRIKPIEVPKYVENGKPNPACPAVRLRDITEAGADATDLPTSGNSDSPR